MNTTADVKARAAQAQANAAANPVINAIPGPSPGVAAFLVGSKSGVLVLLPRLLPGAPDKLKRRYRDRIICNATGTCPGCRQVVDVIAAHVAHEPECSVPMDYRDAKWLDPEGVTFLIAAREAQS